MIFWGGLRGNENLNLIQLKHSLEQNHNTAKGLIVPALHQNTSIFIEV